MNGSPGFVVKAALHEAQGSLRQSRVAMTKLDFPFLDVAVLFPAELSLEGAVSTQPDGRQVCKRMQALMQQSEAGRFRY